MPKTNYINIKIGGRQIDLANIEELGVAIDFELENAEDFQQKRASKTLDVTVPATLENDKTFGSFHDPNIESSVA